MHIEPELSVKPRTSPRTLSKKYSAGTVELLTWSKIFVERASQTNQVFYVTPATR